MKKIILDPCKLTADQMYQAVNKLVQEEEEISNVDKTKETVPE